MPMIDIVDIDGQTGPNNPLNKILVDKSLFIFYIQVIPINQ